ncbi:hypothetical protein QOZ80_1BG0074890 [Eleusine coracana subsp. coracana]|nr:hypothetical protein QOZ80_1BG0074890 [Eleusine coracana subsp. coracana]
MRIRKGSQVEVWIQEAASPVGAWRGGEVQWGNGHSYVLRWHDGGPDSTRISRKSVRPRPPPAPVPANLDAGDMVEVFDEEDCLWKCAEVERAPADGRQFRVKVVGAPRVLTVAPNHLRLRQMLRDDDVWVLLHKVRPRSQPPPSLSLLAPRRGFICASIDVPSLTPRLDSLIQDNQIAGPSATPLRVNGNGHYKPAGPPGLGGASATPLRANGIGYGKDFNPILKKRSPGMFDAKPVANGQRFEDARKKKLCVREEPKLEVEVIDTPKVCMNKQDEISSSSSSSSSSEEEEDSDEDDCDVVGTGSNSDHNEHQQQLQQLDDNNDQDGDSESVSSSDDSSSDSDDSSDSRTRSDNADDRATAAAPVSAPTGDDDHQKPADLLQPFREKDDHRVDDVVVSFGSWGRPPLTDEKAVVQDQIHCLELEAYTALTRAFHASSDALTWEKAELLTDLRKHLNISNDEHLQVINAVSNRKGRRFGRPGNF